MATYGHLVPRYQSWETKPRHPITGEEAVFYWETQGPRGENVREPRWGSNRRELAATVKAMAEHPEVTWVSTAEAAALLGKKASAVRRLIAQGQLVATPVGDGPKPRHLIKGSDLIAYTRGDSKAVGRTTKFAPEVA